MEDDFAMIELLPFDTYTNLRPGVFITKKRNREVFELMERQWKALWETSTPPTDEELAKALFSITT